METVTSQDGTVIAFDRSGRGEPLIVVSGASSDRQADAALASALAEHFDVLNYDRRGRGDSTDTLPFAVEREIDDIAALLDVAGAPPVLVGFSSGAALAARAAASLPVRALVMWEPPYPTDEQGIAAAAAYTLELKKRIDDGDHDGAFTLFLERVGLPAEAIAGMRQSPYWPRGVRLAPTLAYDDAALGGPIPADVFGTISVPALVLSGGASPKMLQDGAKAAAAAIPGSAYGSLDGQTHDVSADLLTAAVVDFASRLPAS
ncbi:alpha/beta fold hydrolase [Sinomonas susongensis]|uniref:alpha/beta fold hydrolase n=1 Tax=Sinomonas susongensis TaxID=1324851 RepID=UPI001107F7A2|nr:alpha/beta hydrolase [Sinomonas susongensis]